MASLLEFFLHEQQALKRNNLYKRITEGYLEQIAGPQGTCMK
jgi:hypothetical protein